MTEAVGGGTDTIYASVDYTLSATTEAEALRANAATGLKLTGNAYSHTLVGNIGNDTLVGGAGNDTINGGAGADSMAGGAGNDTYYIDNPGDIVTEAAGGGTDTIYANVNYTLRAGSQIEFLRANAGATGLSLTGNEFNNTIVGGAGNDILSGGAGNDTLTGGLGSDTFKFMAGFGQDTITDFAASGGDSRSAGPQWPWHHGIDVHGLCEDHSWCGGKRDDRYGQRLDQTSQRRTVKHRYDRLQARLKARKGVGLGRAKPDRRDQWKTIRTFHICIQSPS